MFPSFILWLTSVLLYIKSEKVQIPIYYYGLVVGHLDTMRSTLTYLAQYYFTSRLDQVGKSLNNITYTLDVENKLHQVDCDKTIRKRMVRMLLNVLTIEYT